MTEPRHLDTRRVVVIGPCASGKTSLTTRLQSLGYDARACGQEHSEIPDLWQHLNPDVLIGLHIDLETLRKRRSASWSDRIYTRQIERLRTGFERADLVIDCDSIDQEMVARQVIGWLERHPTPRR
jgi:hypothetical protein